jgi:hypothetical protein
MTADITPEELRILNCCRVVPRGMASSEDGCLIACTALDRPGSGPVPRCRLRDGTCRRYSLLIMSRLV